MPHGFLVLLVLNLLFGSSLAGSKQISARRNAEIHGTVTDITGAWATATTITFRSRKSVYQAKTNEMGDYSVLLPAGTYTLSARQMGFCELRHGEFIAPAGEQIDFDLQLQVCPIDAYGWDNYVELTDANKGGPRPLIYYGKVKTVDDSRVFTGPGFPTPEHPAVLTFNRYSFIADRFAYNSSKRLMIAEGHVTWFKNSETPNHASQVEIRFDRTTAHVTIDAK